MPLNSPPPGSFGEEEEELDDSPQPIYDRVEDESDPPYE